LPLLLLLLPTTLGAAHHLLEARPLAANSRTAPTLIPRLSGHAVFAGLPPFDCLPQTCGRSLIPPPVTASHLSEGAHFPNDNFPESSKPASLLPGRAATASTPFHDCLPRESRAPSLCLRYYSLPQSCCRSSAPLPLGFPTLYEVSPNGTLIPLPLEVPVQVHCLVLLRQRQVPPSPAFSKFRVYGNGPPTLFGTCGARRIDVFDLRLPTAPLALGVAAATTSDMALSLQDAPTTSCNSLPQDPLPVAFVAALKCSLRPPASRLLPVPDYLLRKSPLGNPDLHDSLGK
jgi:hypothetical protein